ncbi:glyoxylate/hydroxypyruvate reductase A [Pseudomonas sp. 148P]|uniref:Glyoxylate/hydroxypyruvate reductase A n=1 Tax=Pseudomonas ulcerans TaxID=3115852 RepID=A0ABU7HVG9_9PSED|nr:MULTISPECIES: glyoxylate/hydroxypyruvate reductase A [unclassified Pseudomonas]MEE1924133.1 glyoxylate/hydroxypyruvate reductase A [Pseudomonas sp. 147P]MEE1935540.1 glyoxylate/hydroxypyruvate reductase A [Pseudomonas sp. 148P]
MASLVLLCQNPALTDWLARLFAEHAPHLQVVRPEDARAREAEVAVCWFPPQGSLARLPNLRLVHSIGSGVDHLANDSSRDPDVPVCRVVDPDHTLGMSEYVHWGVLHFHRGFDQVITGNAVQRWQRPGQRKAQDFRVGVMGLGAIGAPVAVRLAEAGYDVRGWARTPRELAGVSTFGGAQALDGFLDGLNVLVNLLPLTAATHGLLGHAVFQRMARGSALINCGRGQHLDADHLRQALADGQLRGALLDVFEQEPLPADSPLWHTPGVWITPHMASAASDRCIARQVADNVARLANGLALNNLVDPALGY